MDDVIQISSDSLKSPKYEPPSLSPSPSPPSSTSHAQNPDPASYPTSPPLPRESMAYWVRHMKMAQKPPVCPLPTDSVIAVAESSISLPSKKDNPWNIQRRQMLKRKVKTTSLTDDIAKIMSKSTPIHHDKKQKVKSEEMEKMWRNIRGNSPEPEPEIVFESGIKQPSGKNKNSHWSVSVTRYFVFQKYFTFF